MSFRKRNAPLISSTTGRSAIPSPNTQGPVTEDVSLRASQQASVPTTLPTPPRPGVRPSPLDGRPTISTGTQSLDSLLAGHAGFALGNSLLIEESGTTDYAGSLLRFYAAEGVVQGHRVHVVGMGEFWGRELPGVVGAADGTDDTKGGAERNEKQGKMKIAWRYENLGEFGASGSRGGNPFYFSFEYIFYSKPFFYCILIIYD
jgi:elongator complex protein 4